MEKPQYELNVVASVEQLGTITSNMADVKERALAIQNWYQNLVITKDMIQDMKKEKATINKMKDDVSSYRKSIIAEFKKPIDEFERSAKETEKILKDAYDCVNSIILIFENEEKQKMEDELRAFFNEYSEKIHIDFVKFEDSKIVVNLSSSMKKLRVQVTDYLNMIDSHVRALSSMPYDQDKINELVVEYKNTLDFVGSINRCKDRWEALEREKANREALEALKAEEKKAEKKVEKIVEEVAPAKEVKLYTASFRVRGTVDQLRDLKKFLEEEGIEYDTIK